MPILWGLLLISYGVAEMLVMIGLTATMAMNLGVMLLGFVMVGMGCGSVEERETL